MDVDLFDFELPEDRIALRPKTPRESAGLLEVAQDQLSDRRIADLPGLVTSQDLLVFNDTRVLQAALVGLRHRETSHARVALNLHKRVDQSTWRAFVRPAKRLKVGDTIAFADDAGAPDLTAQVVGRAGGDATLRFSRSGDALDAAISAHGSMPLPHYITARRAADTRDLADYQPIFGRHDGSVAAPTASLHFTPDLVSRLEDVGVPMTFLTLHVGAGTFLPVTAGNVEDHVMHGEFGVVSEEAVEAVAACRARGGRVIAVGTTVLRLLETAADGQGGIRSWSGETDIFITPGYRFHVADVLITNFHLPRSTLFMLVSAFSGLDRMKAAYAHAIARGYRFYSYGDATFLHRADHGPHAIGGRDG